MRQFVATAFPSTPCTDGNRKYGGVNRPEPYCLQALEDENQRLTWIVADQELNLHVLEDALGKEW